MNQAARRLLSDTLPSGMVSPLAEQQRVKGPTGTLPMPDAVKSDTPTVPDPGKKTGAPQPSTPPPPLTKPPPPPLAGRSALAAMKADTPVASDMPPLPATPAPPSAAVTKRPSATIPAPTLPRPTPSKPPAAPSTPPPPPAASAPKLRTAPPPGPNLAAPEPALIAEPPRIGDIALESIDAFSDLPEDVQRALVLSAVIEDLEPSVARAGFGALLIIGGSATVCAASVNTPAQRVHAKALLCSKGTLENGVPLRVVGGASGAKVAHWTSEVLDASLRSCPWVLDELRALADKLQVRAGLTIGPLGAVDASIREGLIDRLTPRTLSPLEVVTQEGGNLPGIAFVVAGSVSLLEGNPPEVSGEVTPGEILFPEATWAGAPAPMASRAAPGGAMLLVGDKNVARELVASVPMIAELFAE
jgi:hypothetical protein